jgi:hypothetical protein
MSFSGSSEISLPAIQTVELFGELWPDDPIILHMKDPRPICYHGMVDECEE